MSSLGSRIHIGAGELTLERRLSVFINCPFDHEFQPTFEAIVFCCVCCGFLPRCAIESGTTALPRMTRITEAMVNSKYSIHDLSRCRGEGDENLARFNMPLELGIAMVERLRTTTADGPNHDWLVLVPEGHAYKKFVSDLSGYDPTEYDGKPESAVPAVMSWLATRSDAVVTPTPAAVLRVFPAFRNALVELQAEWHGRAPWADILLTAIHVAQAEGLIAAA
jgi:hypothetical protein